MKVGFIGAGNMAGAIIAGMCADGFAGEDIRRAMRRREEEEQ